MLQAPRAARRGARGAGFSRAGTVDVIGAEAHAEIAERRAAFLVEATSRRRATASARARRATRRPGRRCRGRCRSGPRAASSSQQRPEQLLHMGREPEVEPRLRPVARRARELLVRQQRERAGSSSLSPAASLADDLALPAERAVVGEHESVVDGFARSAAARSSISPASAFCAAAFAASWRSGQPPAGPV